MNHEDRSIPPGDSAARGEVAAGSTTLLEILDDLRNAGYTSQFSAEEGGYLVCSACGARHRAADFEVTGFRRTEGASDAADMNIVVWGTCEPCGTGGVVILGYGPNATAADASVLDDLTLDQSVNRGATPEEAAEAEDPAAQGALHDADAGPT